MKYFLLTFLLLALSCNRINSIEKKPDLLQYYAENMLKISGLSYEIEFLKKDIFTDDTTKSNAKVTFYKHNNSVNFLRVEQTDTENELLFVNDSTWDVSLQEKTMTYLGGKANVKYHGLYIYFPKGFILIDTSLFRNEPYWKISKQPDGFVKIAFTLAQKPADVTEARMEIFVDSAKLCIHRIIEDTKFGNKGNLYQERKLSNYQIFASDSLLIPTYYKNFKRVFQKLPQLQNSRRSSELYLKDLIFKDLDGKKVYLPKEGLVFIDLWYVGCHPCMQAAPVVDQVYKKYKNRIHFYSVNEIDTDMAQIKRFKEKMRIAMPTLIGSQRAVSQIVSDGGYPVFILLDASTGKVLWTTSGYTVNLLNEIETGLAPFVYK